MQWVYEEGHCDAAMRDWDWAAFGLRLATDAEGAAELEAAKAAITALTSSQTKAELFAEAQRRRLLLAPVATPAELVANEHLRARGYWDEVDGRTCPGPFVSRRRGRCRRSARRPRSASTPAAGPTRRAATRRRARRRRRRACPLAGLNVVDLTWVFAGPLATRVLADFGATVVKVEGPATPTPPAAAAARCSGDLGLEGSVAFAHFNCGKLGLSLDLNNADGRTSCATSSAGPTCSSSRTRPA